MNKASKETNKQSLYKKAMTHYLLKLNLEWLLGTYLKKHMIASKFATGKKKKNPSPCFHSEKNAEFIRQ